MSTTETPTRVRPSEQALGNLRSRCRGVLPLDARLEPWMVSLLTDRQNELQNAVEHFGSPLNVLSTSPMTRHLYELNTVAERHNLSFRVFFARKANKCLALVDSASDSGAGIDVASEQECRQVLDRGIAGRDIICTAAVKTRSLVEVCIEHSVTIVIDNWDELHCVREVSESIERDVLVAVRVSGFGHGGVKLHSRFGFDIDDVAELISQPAETDGQNRVRIAGLHFHLDGYSAEQRVSAIRQLLPLIDQFRSRAFDIRFLDIGGGFPMSYLESESQWNDFWIAHGHALLGKREPITYQNHGLGFLAVDGELHGRRNVYPYFQSPTRGEWLDQILAAPSGDGGSIAHALRRRSIELRCEPGRSVLDGCGVTVARVEFVKQHHGGDWFIGLAMNRTQCRTSSDDFLVDPLLIPGAEAHRGEQRLTAGYLVGAYCTESELLALRRLRFSKGIARGDLVVFPNTAGYFMHFLESRSHQFPLARNVVVDDTTTGRFKLDDIDA